MKFTPTFPDDAKTKEVILYVARACLDDEAYGVTKLNKILFYSDFLSFLTRGKSITGQDYFALGEGPALRRFMPIKEEMEQAKELAIENRDYFGYTQKRPLALRTPHLEKLEAPELEIIRQVIEKLKPMGAKQASEFSHKFSGWEIAFRSGSETIIPYESVLMDTEGFWGIESPELPEELVTKGMELAKAHGLVLA